MTLQKWIEQAEQDRATEKDMRQRVARQWALVRAADTHSEEMRRQWQEMERERAAVAYRVGIAQAIIAAFADDRPVTPGEQE